MQEKHNTPKWKIKLEEILKDATYYNDENKLRRLTQISKDKIAKMLEEESKQYESQIPNLEIGAMCSGYFLCQRGYSRLNDFFIKPENCKTYIFEAIGVIKSEAVTSVNIHPFYELKHILK